MSDLYADASGPSLRDGSISVWTNLGGLGRAMLALPYVRQCYEPQARDGEHCCYVVLLWLVGDYEAFCRAVNDCLVVERMLEYVDLVWEDKSL